MLEKLLAHSMTVGDAAVSECEDRGEHINAMLRVTCQQTLAQRLEEFSQPLPDSLVHNLDLGFTPVLRSSAIGAVHCRGVRPPDHDLGVFVVTVGLCAFLCYRLRLGSHLPLVSNCWRNPHP